MDQNDPRQELRERLVEQIRALDTLPAVFTEDPTRLPKALDAIDQVCNVLVQHRRAQNPATQEAMIRAVEGALRGAAEVAETLDIPFVELLRPYIRQVVALCEMEKEPALSAGAPRITVRTLIIPGSKTTEGLLVEGVSKVWFEILRRFQDNPESIYQIGWREWEEIIAGAYKQEGWETVILTPRSGDEGRDVIATRADWGQLRFLLLDQMRAYRAEHLIGPGEIREMKGVLLDHPQATKGLITTTSGFTRGAFKAADKLDPRLELRPRDKLLAWLASVQAK